MASSKKIQAILVTGQVMTFEGVDWHTVTTQLRAAGWVFVPLGDTEILLFKTGVAAMVEVP